MRWWPKLISKYSNDYGNLPERYIRRTMRKVYWKTPNAINYRPAVDERETYLYGLDRSWTQGFKDLNQRPRLPVLIEPLRDWPIFRGDRVEVLVGKDKGKQGFVNYIVQERNWVIVEGLNCNYEYFGARGDYPGVMSKREQPLLVTTEVALVDPSDNKATKIQWRFTEEGEKVRVSVRSGRIIPKPIKSQETIDYKTKNTYKEQPKDTVKEDLEAITFQPSLKTFEMDIMDEMNIKEDKVPQKTYWY